MHSCVKCWISCSLSLSDQTIANTKALINRTVIRDALREILADIPAFRALVAADGSRGNSGSINTSADTLGKYKRKCRHPLAAVQSHL